MISMKKIIIKEKFTCILKTLYNLNKTAENHLHDEGLFIISIYE